MRCDDRTRAGCGIVADRGGEFVAEARAWIEPGAGIGGRMGVGLVVEWLRPGFVPHETFFDNDTKWGTPGLSKMRDSDAWESGLATTIKVKTD